MRVSKANEDGFERGDAERFHGGTRDTPMVHVAANGGGAPERGEPVTDDDHDEGFV